MAGIAPNRAGSQVLISTTGTPALPFAVVRDKIIGAVAVDANTAKLFMADGTQITITATAQQVLDAIDPAPPAPPTLPTPPSDITQGKDRISPDGAARAHRLQALNPKGDWIIYHIASNEISWFFATDASNPEIATWPYLHT